MKPQYQVRNQAREMHNGSKALFDTVKIHIHVDPRKSVWDHSVLSLVLLFQKEGFVCVYKVKGEDVLLSVSRECLVWC